MSSVSLDRVRAVNKKLDQINKDNIRSESNLASAKTHMERTLEALAKKGLDFRTIYQEKGIAGLREAVMAAREKESQRLESQLVESERVIEAYQAHDYGKMRELLGVNEVSAAIETSSEPVQVEVEEPVQVEVEEPVQVEVEEPVQVEVEEPVQAEAPVESQGAFDEDEEDSFSFDSDEDGFEEDQPEKEEVNKNSLTLGDLGGFEDTEDEEDDVGSVGSFVLDYEDDDDDEDQPEFSFGDFLSGSDGAL